MRLSCSRYITLLFILPLLLSWGRLASSHPHNWIQLTSGFVLDDSARLVQIKQRWEFDVFYSLMTYADVLNEFGEEKKGLIKTGDRMINNLKSYDYFSVLKIDGQEIPLGVPDQHRLTTKQKEGQIVLELEMTFDIEANVAVENKTIAWQVYDPTYYIAMNHATEGDIKVIGGNATECSTKLEFPDPSDDLIEYAQSLDRTQKDTKGLGESFAETAFIQCI